MSTNEHEGPLSRLMRGLGLDADLAPIAAVKRIDERPVSLNPELLFTQIPEQMSDAGIEHLELYKDGPSLPTTFDPVRRRMVYDRIPVGHDVGYRCYDGGKHDAESAFTSGEFGDGLSENEAYVDWLRNVDEPEPKPRASRVIHSSPFEPPTYDDRDVTFDDGLTDDDAR